MSALEDESKLSNRNGSGEVTTERGRDERQKQMQKGETFTH